MAQIKLSKFNSDKGVITGKVQTPTGLKRINRKIADIMEEYEITSGNRATVWNTYVSEYDYARQGADEPGTAN